ncbi:cation-translocating P-type ATPase [Aquitalea sp. USM4]|uniref:heavy metal translocating P-type ATPase n=2 Tax=Aquitalea TaxID=407217 RepID=UPI001A954BEB|nr:cation-translocating P-type ATPase [Aquitalea sp. USM4]
MSQCCPHPHHGLLDAAEQQRSARQLQLALLAIGLLLLAGIWHFLIPDGQIIAQWLTSAAALLMAVPLLRAAWHSLQHPDLHGMTDLLVALAMLGAWASGDTLSAALLPILMVLGHVLEERSLLGSQEAIRALASLTSSRSRRYRPDGSLEEVDNSQLRSGDRVEVRPGERIPADGMVVSGQSSLDTSAITGEALPQDVVPGSQVYAGAVNLQGLLQLEVSQVGEQSALGRISALMQQAEQAKPPVTRLVESHAASYMGLVLAIAALCWFVSHDSQAMLAVLVAACPCALVLAAPSTAVAGVAVAARHGVLIRGAAFLEELADVNALVIDKTGTLTSGQLAVQSVDTLVNDSPVEAVWLAAGLAACSTHPVSRALAALATDQPAPALRNVQELPGMGMQADSDWGQVLLGRPALLQQMGVPGERPARSTASLTGLALDGRLLAWFHLADSPRAEAAEAMQQLRQLGLQRQILLTGDHRQAAEPVGQALAMDRVVAQVLPAGKLKEVQAEISAGYRPLVVGDGINDSLALKAGAVGVAMGASAADIAVAAADVVLISHDLRRLATAIRLSRLCRRVLAQNVVLGLGWAVALTLLAAFGLLGSAGVLLAAVLHNLSTLLVMANAGRLLRFHEPLSAVTHKG